MSGKWLVPLILIFVVPGGKNAQAQVPPTPAQTPKSILGRLDQFGQDLFGGIFGDGRTERAQPDAAHEPMDYETVPRVQGEIQPRAGAYRPQPGPQAVRPQTAGAASPGEPVPSRVGSMRDAPARQTPAKAPARSSPVLGGPPAPAEDTEGRRYWQESPPVSRTLAPPGVSPHPASSPGASEPTVVPHPGHRPLHQRLSVMRDSAFGSADPAPAEPEPGSGPNADAASDPPEANDPPGTGRDGHLVVAQPAGEGPRQPASTRPIGPTPAPDEVVRSPAAGSSPAVGGERSPGSERYESMLFAQKGPVLNVETFGPRTMAIGRESSYRVSMQNSGEVAADEVVVYIQLPAWADVLGAEASTGATQLAADGEGAFVWKVGHVQAQSSEQLTLRLVPRQSRPFDLAVRWEYQPLSQQMLIEVQEPKLEVQLEGPREVHYGQRETYRLRFRNTGNGPAENVMITLLPVGAGGSQPVSHLLGVVQAGAEKIVEVELTAKQTGTIEVRVEARGDGNLEAELAEQILVRRAALELAASGPSVRFVGSEVEYALRVANPGNAPARNIQLSAALPAGAKYLSGIEGGHLEANGTRISWIVPLLEPGSEERYQIRASLGLPGTNRLELAARADDALTASAETLTRVEAMADLAMEVENPRAPVPVGSDTVYKLRIRNRGTKAAENVEIIAYFSRGIEPVSAEGGTHRIGPGQVVFSPIPSLAAGGEVVLTVRARAEEPGNHIFRAEIHCKPLDTRLVREETTHFYQDGSNMATAPKAGPMNTADRRAAAGEAVPPGALSQPAPEPRR